MQSKEECLRQICGIGLVLGDPSCTILYIYLSVPSLRSGHHVVSYVTGRKYTGRNVINEWIPETHAG
jgi:hypothetical protein